MRLALTLPMSSATCQRSFSAMRRVKNYLRSIMYQDHFSAISLLNNESDIARDIDKYSAIAVYITSPMKSAMLLLIIVKIIIMIIIIISNRNKIVKRLIPAALMQHRSSNLRFCAELC